jgi:hypothetical protein
MPIFLWQVAGVEYTNGDQPGVTMKHLGMVGNRLRIIE